MSKRSLEEIIGELTAEQGSSRRSFVGRVGAAGFALSGASTLLAACGGVKGTADKGDKAFKSVTHAKEAIGRINISNWQLYVDKAVLKQFERENKGADIKYVEDVNDNDEFFSKVRPQLEAGKDTKRDIMVLTDWMTARLVRLGYLEPLDKKNIPNISNLQPSLANPPFDKGLRYSLPWQSGMTAIGYNKKKVGGKLTSINDMFDPKFKGRVSMLAEPRDSAGLVLLSQGIKPEEATIDQVLKAIDKIGEESKKGQIRRFTGNDYTTDLANGNLWISVAYSGDIIQLQADNPDLEFLIPEEGAIIWSDNMLMPKKVQHPYAAERFMNFVYEPEVAAKIAAYVNYVTPVQGAKEILAKTDPKLAEDQLIFPSEETLSKLHPLPNLSPADERKMNAAMQKVVGG